MALRDGGVAAVPAQGACAPMLLGRAVADPIVVASGVDYMMCR